MLQQERHARVNRLGLDDVVVVEHENQFVERGATSLRKVASKLSMGGSSCAASRVATALAPTSGAHRCSARNTYVQNVSGLLSPGSSESQATGRSIGRQPFSNRVVLPKPAGAQTSVSFARNPQFNSAMSRPRGTEDSRVGGT